MILSHNRYGKPWRAIAWTSALVLIPANAMADEQKPRVMNDRVINRVIKDRVIKDRVINDLVINDLVILAIDQVSVPALETGVLSTVMVEEGDTVARGKLLAQLDDEQARIAEAIALNELKISSDRAKNHLAVELAEKNIQHLEQLATQHGLTREIARRKAENQVRILAAQKAEAVAKNELSRASEARRAYIDSVSRSEIDGLRLAYERANLETEQAKFDREIDELTAASEDEVSSIHQLNIQRGRVEREQTEYERKIAQLNVTDKKYAAEMASLFAKRHWITAPIDGSVVEIYRQPGEWVPQGQPVVRLVRLDRLRAEGFVSTRWLRFLKKGKKAELTIHVSDDEDLHREGQVSFVSPEIDSVNDEVRFWVEFDNRDRDVLPGMRLRLTLQVRDE